MKVTYSQLTDLTGQHYRTIKRRLDDANISPSGKDGRSIFFDSRKALPVLFGKKGADDEIDLQRERALESRERRRKLERLNDIEERTVAPHEILTDALSKTCTQIAAIFDALPLNLKRANPNLTASDIDIVKTEIAKIRNLAAQSKLK